MKIRYHKLTRNTDLSKSELIKNILRELDRPGYYVAKQDALSVQFVYNIWRLASRNEPFKRVDGGTFEIIPNAYSISLSYYISVMVEVIVSIIIVIIALTKDHQPLVFLPFIWVMFMFRKASVKKVANRMITNISQNS